LLFIKGCFRLPYHLAAFTHPHPIQPTHPTHPHPTPPGDVAASGGYYMAMGCSAIVAKPLTITGSIGVVTGKFNLAELYQRAG